MDAPDPARLQVNTTEQTLTIEWEDDHVSVFPLDRLRDACPCANCGGTEIDTIEPPGASWNTPDQRWTDLQIEPAGSVGIRITWDDGHRDGIFQWDRLRSLQPPPDG